MSTIVVSVIIVAVIVIFCFAKDSHTESRKLQKEGGMMVKYKTLIENFVAPTTGLKVVKMTNNYVCTAMTNSSGTLAFHFQHTFNKINVTFELKNVFLGEHKLEWDFPETMPQEDMVRHIETRTRQYMDNVTAKYK